MEKGKYFFSKIPCHECIREIVIFIFGRSQNTKKPLLMLHFTRGFRVSTAKLIFTVKMSKHLEKYNFHKMVQQFFFFFDA